MEEIISLKEKHVKVTAGQLKELLQTKMKSMDHVKNREQQFFIENDNKIQDLASKISSMKETLKSETQTLEQKNRELSKHQERVRELEAERNKYLQQNQALELQRNKLKLCKPNVKDQEVLEQGRRRLALYKELTRIRWDYEAPEDHAEGYVSNKTDYIHRFSFKPTEGKNLSDLVWREVYRSTSQGADRENDNKENTKLN